MKFGRIKKQHGRILGLDELCKKILDHCPYVERIIPGRITTRKGNQGISFKVQYLTESGLKCLYRAPGTVQEVFLICSDGELAREWLVEQKLDPSS